MASVNDHVTGTANGEPFQAVVILRVVADGCGMGGPALVASESAGVGEKSQFDSQLLGLPATDALLVRESVVGSKRGPAPYG